MFTEQTLERGKVVSEKRVIAQVAVHNDLRAASAPAMAAAAANATAKKSASRAQAKARHDAHACVERLQRGASPSARVK
jgi:hypothetical protein